MLKKAPLRARLFFYLRAPFQNAKRGKRMDIFVEKCEVKANDRILDLGGQAAIWDTVTIPLDITILNLPGVKVMRPEHSIHNFTYVEGDACNISEFDPSDFDIVFSNSVIEHVGPESKQQEFATEVLRMSNGAYWVQTPSPLFPMEAHTGLPLWWLYPAPLKRWFLRGWKRKIPKWAEMVEGTRVISKRQMANYFTDSKVYTEWCLGFPKSYSCYRPRKKEKGDA